LKQYKQNDNNLAIAYYRYSSHSQNEASIEQQQEQAQKYALAHGFTILREYRDKAISGTTDERPDFQRMLAEVNKLKPAVLILWKTDRLGRDKYVLVNAKHTIRSAGCSIHYVAESIPDNSSESVILESVIEGMAEFYSKNLSQNITRGMRYNAERAVCNGYKVIGYKKGNDGKYAVDEITAPVVQRIFNEYSDGKPMTEIADNLNNQGLRSLKGNKFSIHSLRKILKNRAYVGEYKFSDIIVPDGMPALINKELFVEVQKRFNLNKRKGSQRANGLEDAAPRYWLTGKLFCGECGESMHGMSGTSLTGAIYYYYACKNHRKKLKCPKKNVRKDVIEKLVVDLLNGFLHDSEKLASLAVDVTEHYKKLYSGTEYLDGLVAEKKRTEAALTNLVKAIEMGIFSETTQSRLMELEVQKKAFSASIDVEKAKQNVLQDEHSIRHYFELYAHADFTNTDVRDMVFEYFIDKIYLYEDRLMITCWYSEEHIEVPWDEISQAVDKFDSFASCFTTEKHRQITGAFSIFRFSIFPTLLLIRSQTFLIHSKYHSQSKDRVISNNDAALSYR